MKLQNVKTGFAGLKAKVTFGILPFRKSFDDLWPVIDSVEGFLVSPIQERWLFETARSLPNCTNIVEIGSYKGRSTCCLAFGCKYGRKSTITSGKHVFAIDKNFPDEFVENLGRCGLASYVTAFQGISWDVAKTWDKPIQLLFIDGSHHYDDVVADFDGFFPYVVSGGVVAVHDVIDTWPEVKRAWNGHISQRLVDIGNCHSLYFGTKPNQNNRGLREATHDD